jgi:dynein heavy chain
MDCINVAAPPAGFSGPTINTHPNTQAVPGLGKEQLDHLYSLFDAHVEAGLAWVRREGGDYILSVDSNLTASLCLIIQVRAWLVASLPPPVPARALERHCTRLTTAACTPVINALWPLQSLLDPSRGCKASSLQGDAFTQAANRLFVFAYIWAIGGNLAPASRAGFDEFVRQQLQDVANLPGAQSGHACVRGRHVTQPDNLLLPLS